MVTPGSRGKGPAGVNRGAPAGPCAPRGPLRRLPFAVGLEGGEDLNALSTRGLLRVVGVYGIAGCRMSKADVLTPLIVQGNLRVLSTPAC
jgi:hypothetical protein